MNWLIWRLYPKRIQAEYGVEIEDFLLERAATARSAGWTRLAGWYIEALVDVMRTHWDEWRSSWGGNGKTTRGGTMNVILQDLKYASRRLMKTPGFTLGAIAIMAIAIGVNASVFTLVNGLLLKPSPFGDSDRLVNIYQHSDGGDPNSTSYPAFRDMTAFTDVFESVAATSPSNATLETEAGLAPIATEYVTSGMMQALGLDMSRGRWFDPDMDFPGAGNFAVASHHAWVNRFSADPGFVGQTIRVNRQPVTVIGIGPESYNGMGGFIVTDFFLSISSTEIEGPFRVANLDRRSDHWYDVRARLAPGVTADQAQQAMTTLAADLATNFPEFNEGRGITVLPSDDIRLHPRVDGAILGVSSALMAIVLLVLLLASSNLGSLLLVRGLARHSEVAVRRAMGAGAGRVRSLFLSEALLLTAVGGAVGLLLTGWSLTLLGAISLPDPLAGEIDIGIDWRVLSFSLGLILVTGLAFGWAPASNSMRTDVGKALREDSRSASGGRRAAVLRNALVALQVAVSLILVVGAGVAVSALVSVSRVDAGFDVDRLAWVRTDFSDTGLTSEERGPIGDELMIRLSALPGVSSAAVASRLPVEVGGSTTTVIEGYEPASGTDAVELDWAQISPGYFRTMGVDLVEGRTFDESDQSGDGMIVVVNQTAARLFWGDRPAVGRRMRSQGSTESWRQVIGVVEDVPVGSLSEVTPPLLYFVMGETIMAQPTILLRTENDPISSLAGIRGIFQEVDRSLPVEMNTMTAHFGEALSVPRAAAGAMGLFSLMALALASIGIYSMVSFTVAGQLPEIGIRVALGAAKGSVVRMIVGKIFLTVGTGLALGALAVVIAGRLIGPFAVGVDLLDPVTLIAALGLLSLAVGVASTVPALRAANANPIDALRR